MVPDGPCFFHLATTSPNPASLLPPTGLRSPRPGLLSSTGYQYQAWAVSHSHFITAYTKTSFFWWELVLVLSSLLCFFISTYTWVCWSNRPLPLHPSPFLVPLPLNFATVADLVTVAAGDSQRPLPVPGINRRLDKTQHRT